MYDIYQPQGKVMFLEASFSHSVHRGWGWADPLGGRPPLAADPPGGRRPCTKLINLDQTAHETRTHIQMWQAVGRHSTEVLFMLKDR